MIKVFLTAVLVLLLGPVQARPNDAAALLDKAAKATQKLNYSGVFIYQRAGDSETSRITHVIEAGKEYEHLEVLDGPPREVVRTSDEVKCFLPATHTLIIEKSRQRSFSSLLPVQTAGLSEYYAVREEKPVRIAGIETRSILLEPKDEYRHRYQFWIDPQSGLVLKAVRFNEHGERIESFAFSEIKVGGRFPKEAEKLRKKMPGGDWHVESVATRETAFDKQGWQIATPLPGYRLVASMQRKAGADTPAGQHLIFSDGLSSISVFIEPLAGRKAAAEPELHAMGAVNVYKRTSGAYQILVMGEVPPQALRRLGDGIEHVK